MLQHPTCIFKVVACTRVVTKHYSLTSIDQTSIAVQSLQNLMDSLFQLKAVHFCPTNPLFITDCMMYDVYENYL